MGRYSFVRKTGGHTDRMENDEAVNAAAKSIAPIESFIANRRGC